MTSLSHVQRLHGKPTTGNLRLIIVSILLLSGFVTAHECSGHGQRHGNHCHCDKGYINQGTECFVENGPAAAGMTCPPGGIAWELSLLMYLEKGSYSIQLTNNLENMATLLLPVADTITTKDTMQEALAKSTQAASQRVQDIALPRKLVKNGQVMAPSANLLYIVLRNDAEQMQQRKVECEKTPGNTWHIDHCDSSDGHGRVRRLDDPNSNATAMNMNLTVMEPSHYAFHWQHDAIQEFQMKILKDDGSHVQPLLTKTPDQRQEPGLDHKSTQSKRASGSVWIKTMIAVLIVALLSVVGILLLALRSSMLNRLMDSFMALSAGALFGAAFIHILPEAIEFYSEYGQMDLTLCLVFTAGFAIAMIVEMLLAVWIGQVAGGTTGHDTMDDVTLFDSDGASGLVKHEQPLPNQDFELSHSSNPVFMEMPRAGHSHGHPHHHHGVIRAIASPPESKWSLQVTWSQIKPMAYIILIGDLFHNFVDGILIATAFLACDDALGIAVTASAILHEVPQEFADFIILVDCGFTTFQAVIFNLISALSAILGAGIILCAIKVTSETMGLLLGFGAGTLVYIAATDLLPRVLEVKSMKDFFVRLMLFGIGVAVLALTSLYHVHCNADI